MATADVGGFFEYQPTEHDFFRGVILFGLNSATYKFALAKSLLELAAEGREAVSLEDLAIPFAKHITAHIAEAPKQGTNPGKFLKECARFTAIIPSAVHSDAVHPNNCDLFGLVDGYGFVDSYTFV